VGVAVGLVAAGGPCRETDKCPGVGRHRRAGGVCAVLPPAL